MKIAIYCVTYHSYSSLTNYLASIDLSAAQAPEGISVKVFVADNTVPASPVGYTPEHFELTVVPTGKNLGYFGAIRLLMESADPTGFDYTIISNVDVLLSSQFFAQLASSRMDTGIGWIAPKIFSQSRGVDFNPQAVSRYTLRKMYTLRLMFKHPWLLRLKQKLFHVYREFKDCPPGYIYAGHGSFIILTKQYFQRCGLIDYPNFLYGEELYLAEECLSHQLRVYYCPSIEVTDIGRISTGNIPSRQYCRYNYLGINHAINTYYKTH